MKQSVHLGEFALAALAGEGERGTEVDLAIILDSAIRFYLNDRGLDRPGWLYPGFLPEKEVNGVIELDVEQDLWRGLEEEAGRQGTSVSQLTNHVALYYAAEVSSGRLTQRIADNLDDEVT